MKDVRRCCCWLVLVGGMVLMAGLQTAQAQVRVVAVLGEIAPDTSDPFVDFSTPVLNNNGETAFHGFVNEDEYFGGLWSEGDGGGLLRNVVMVGDPAPGTSGNFDDFSGPGLYFHLSDLGDVAFYGYAEDFSAEGVWTDRERPTNNVSPIALEGDTAPGTTDPNREFRFISPTGFNNIASQIAFYSSMPPTASPPGNFPSSGIFYEDIGLNLNKVAEVADFAPGTFRPSTGTEAQFDLFSFPAINDSGHVSFMAETNASSGVTSVGDAGVWTTSDDFTLKKVALHNETAPDSDLDGGGDRKFSILFRGGVTMNNAGDTAFIATLTDLYNGKLREGIWVSRNGGLEKVAIESQPAPGAGTNFDEITSDALIDGEGHVSFEATLEDGRDSLWSETATGLEPVAVEGDPAPGTSTTFSNFVRFAVNDSGAVVFYAELDDFSEGIWAQDAGGNLRRIIGQGDMIEVDIGDVREIEFVDFLALTGFLNSGGGGVTDGWNDSYQLAFHASFLDENGTSGVFVSDALTTPLGDMNGDGEVTEADIPFFVQALTDREAYDANVFLTPTISALPISADVVGDVDQDGAFNLGDVQAFKALFDGSGAATAIVPEPGALLMAIGGVAGFAYARRRGSLNRNRCLS